MASGGRRARAGRPKGSKSKTGGKRIQERAALSEQARVHTKAMLATLVRVAEDDEETASARVSAAIAVLDRGYGRPAQTVEASGPDGGSIEVELSTKEICRRIIFAFAKAEQE